MNEHVILASHLCKVYRVGDINIEALRDVNLKVEKGEFIVVSGPSGAGKTTLLNIIGSIDKPTSGKIIVLGRDLTVEDEDSLSQFRCENIGFVFQSYNLISTLTVSENIAFPMEWTRKEENRTENRVQELLEMVELKPRADHFPSQLSGGEQQRVAFARALVNDPPLLLVDEPTGDLDERTSEKIVHVLRQSKNEKKTIMVATHDERIVQLADRKLRVENGKFVNLDE